MLRRLRARGVGRGGELSPFVFDIQAPPAGQSSWSMRVQSPGAAPRSFAAESCEALAQAAMTILQLSWMEATPKPKPDRPPKREAKAGQSSKNTQTSSSSSSSLGGASSSGSTDASGSGVSKDRMESQEGDWEATAVDDEAAKLNKELELEVESTPVLKYEDRPRPQRRPQGRAFARRRRRPVDWSLRRLEIGLGAGMTLGHLPTISPALALSVAPRWRRVSLRLRSLAMGNRIERSNAANLRFGADFWAGDGELSICADFPVGASWLGDLCAGGGPNYIWGRGRGELARPQSQVLLYWSYALSASFAYRRPQSAWSPHLLFRLSHAPTTPRFSVLGADQDLCCKQHFRGELVLGIRFDVLARSRRKRPKATTPVMVREQAEFKAWDLAFSRNKAAVLSGNPPFMWSQSTAPGGVSR